MGDTNNDYEKEIRKISYEVFLEERGAAGYFSNTQEKIMEGIEEFRDTIHSREMAKKDEEIERLKEVASKFNTETANVRLNLTSEIENLKHEMKFIGVEPDEDDFERYPLPICFDPREEQKELYRRHCKIKEDHKEWEKLTHAHELTRLNKEIERLKGLLEKTPALNKIIARLISDVKYGEREGDDMDAISWGMQEGTIISLNEAKEIIQALTKTDNP